MKPVVNFKAVRKLFSKDHPPFVILHQQKLIYISKEAGEVLDISNPAWPLHQSPAASLFKNDTLPVSSSNPTSDVLDLIQLFRSQPHLSRLLRCYLQLNQPEVASFARWALRELIPQATREKKTQHFTRNGLHLIYLDDKQRYEHLRQILVVPGGIEAKTGYRISGIDDEEDPVKGGESCPKR